jgi:hypothetical protein
VVWVVWCAGVFLWGRATPPPPGTVTLLTATKDAEHSQAAVLAEQLAKGTGPDA